MDRLHPCHTRLTLRVPPRVSPSRSGFFRAGVRVVHFDLAPLALAYGLAGLAPGPVALPRDAGVVQHRPNDVRADLRQAIRCTPQRTLQSVQRPRCRPISLTVRWSSKLGQNPVTLLWTVLRRRSTTSLPFHRAQADLVETCDPHCD